MRSNAAAMNPRSVLSVAVVLSLSLIVALLLFLTGERQAGTAASEGGDLVLAQETSDAAGEDDGPTIDAVSLDVTYDVVFSRDPFESIRPPEPVSADPSNGTTTNGTTTNGTTTDGTTTNGTTTNGTTTDGTTTNGTTDGAPSKDAPVTDDGVCRTGSEAVCDGIVVVLTSVSSTTAQIDVNGVPFIVQPGDAFANNFQLLRIVDDCVEVLYLDGDEADVFSLCVGGVVAK